MPLSVDNYTFGSDPLRGHLSTSWVRTLDPKNANRWILLYPRQEDLVDLEVWEVISTFNTIEMSAVRNDDYWGTVEELRKMIGNVRYLWKITLS